MDMAEHLSEFDKFVEQMRTKIIECSGKHQHDKTTLNNLKCHLVGEILELFMIEDFNEIVTIWHILSSHDLDVNEFHDVANMCWILKFFIESEA